MKGMCFVKSVRDGLNAIALLEPCLCLACCLLVFYENDRDELLTGMALTGMAIAMKNDRDRMKEELLALIAG